MRRATDRLVDATARRVVELRDGAGFAPAAPKSKVPAGFRGPVVSTVIHLPVRSTSGPLLTKKHLAAQLGRSTRWIELRMREGMPVAPRGTPSEHARFDLGAVSAWLDSRGGAPRLPLEQRVAQLEREMSTLVAELKRRAG